MRNRVSLFIEEVALALKNVPKGRKNGFSTNNPLSTHAQSKYIQGSSLRTF